MSLHPVNEANIGQACNELQTGSMSSDASFVEYGSQVGRHSRIAQFRTVSNHLGCEKVGVLLGAMVVGFGVESPDSEDSEEVTESWRPTDAAAAASASELSIDDRLRDERS